MMMPHNFLIVCMNDYFLCNMKYWHFVPHVQTFTLPSAFLLLLFLPWWWPTAAFTPHHCLTVLYDHWPKCKIHDTDTWPRDTWVSKRDHKILMSECLLSGCPACKTQSRQPLLWVWVSPQLSCNQFLSDTNLISTSVTAPDCVAMT